VHNGYFSIDKKKVGGKTVEMVKDTSGSTAADDDTYNLIMRDKEKLLSFESPLKFIFSHSALKEGWDNPNVFQICNFSTRETERWRRQTIGRGLRLCVNQQGERLRGFEINTLTVIATELRAVRRKAAEGLRGCGHRLRHRQAACLLCDFRGARKRRTCRTGLRGIKGLVDAPQGAGLHHRQGQGSRR
jgi:superfamily II DNA or RNA helicase